VAKFLEARGLQEQALAVATDPDFRFELAVRLLGFSRVLKQDSWQLHPVATDSDHRCQLECVAWSALLSGSFVQVLDGGGICTPCSRPIGAQEVAVTCSAQQLER